MNLGDILRIHPRQTRQRQPQAHRRIAGQQIQLLAAQHPRSGLPFRTGFSRAALQRQHHAHRRFQPLLEHFADALPLQRIRQLILRRIHIDRQLPLLMQMVELIFEGRHDVARIEPQAPRQRLRESLGFGHAKLVVDLIARQQFAISPQRHAIGAPVTSQSPARQRLPRIPFALPVMQQPSASETLAPDARANAPPAAASQDRAPRCSTPRLPCCRSIRRSARRPSSNGCRRRRSPGPPDSPAPECAPTARSV